MEKIGFEELIKKIVLYNCIECIPEIAINSIDD